MKTKKLQLIQYRKVVLHNNIATQRKAISRKNNIVQLHKRANGILTTKEIKYFQRNPNLESSIQQRTTLSNRRIGQIFNRSSTSGKRYQAQMKDLKLIESKPFFEVVKRNVSYFEYLEMYSYSPILYHFKGRCLVKQLSNTINIHMQ